MIEKKNIIDLTIITVTWNSAETIVEQIRSVLTGCQEISFEQIVVDNASPDNTVEVIRLNFPKVQIIKNLRNEGFAFSNNSAVKFARGKFILFLNPDMKVEKGSLDKLVNWMNKNKDVGLASCKLLDIHGNFNIETKPRKFPKTWEMVVLILKIYYFIPGLLNTYFYSDFDPSKEQEVDTVRGSFLIMRREIIDKLGWAFDPRYYIWFEDVDICREAKKLGYTIKYTPICSCLDYFGLSFEKKNRLWKQKNFNKSMISYFKKWEPWYKWIWIVMIYPFGILIVCILNNLDYFIKKSLLPFLRKK